MFKNDKHTGPDGSILHRMTRPLGPNGRLTVSVRILPGDSRDTAAKKLRAGRVNLHRLGKL